MKSEGTRKDSSMIWKPQVCYTFRILLFACLIFLTGMKAKKTVRKFVP